MSATRIEKMDPEAFKTYITNYEQSLSPNGNIGGYRFFENSLDESDLDNPAGGGNGDVQRDTLDLEKVMAGTNTGPFDVQALVLRMPGNVASDWISLEEGLWFVNAG